MKNIRTNIHGSQLQRISQAEIQTSLQQNTFAIKNNRYQGKTKDKKKLKSSQIPLKKTLQKCVNKGQ